MTELNIAPTQLHPNSWTFIRAFIILYAQVSISSSVEVFYNFFEAKHTSSKLRVSLNGALGRTLFSLFQSSYKNFKGKFVKVRTTTGDPTLLDGFPLYWTPEPKFQSARRFKDLSPKDQGICQFLSSLKVVFDTSYLITKEYILGALKAYTGTPHFPLLVKINLLPLTNHLLIFFAERMLNHFSKAELAEMAKDMRVAANMSKDSLTQKKKAPITIT